MKISAFLYHNPETEQPERVYQFPWFMASASERVFGSYRLFSKEPIQRPLIMITDNYLTRIKGGEVDVELTDDYPNDL